MSIPKKLVALQRNSLCSLSGKALSLQMKVKKNNNSEDFFVIF